MYTHTGETNNEQQHDSTKESTQQLKRVNFNQKKKLTTDTSK